jgi:DNA-binding NtrC family response regulator
LAKILVVDDDEQIRTFLRLFLSKAGHEVKTASTLEAAQQACRSEGFDVVLSAADKPIDGHQLARWVAGEFPECRMALMATSETECGECPHAGQCPVFIKPFDLKRFLDFLSGRP